MEQNVSRRDFLGRGVGAALGLVLPAGACASERPQARPSIAGRLGLGLGLGLGVRPGFRFRAARRLRAVSQTVRLADHIIVVATEGSNVLMVASEGESVLIGGGAPAQARDLLRLIEHETARAVVPTLINTHWHSAHTG